MRHNIPKELNQAMDQLSFSPEAKQRMVKNLMLTQTPPVEQNRKSPALKRMLAVALVAAAALVTLTGAAAFTRWSHNAQVRYQPSQQVKEQAKDSGLSVMLDDKSTQPSSQQDTKEVLSATDRGITVTAVQTIADKYGCELTFRVEGFQLPAEDIQPWAWDSVTIDGSRDFYTSLTGGFYDGTTHNENGEWVYASNGQPVASRQDKYHSAIMDWVADDGSMEYTIYIDFRDQSGAYFGKEIAVHFDGFGTAPMKGGIMEEKLVDGDWDLRWTLTGADSDSSTVTITPNAEIGDSGLTLLEAEIGQKSIQAVYQSDHDWDGWKQLEPLSPPLHKVIMNDGTSVQVYPTTEDYHRWETERICVVTYSTIYGILDISNLESLVYLVGSGSEKDAYGKSTAQNYEIPIQ